MESTATAGATSHKPVSPSPSLLTNDRKRRHDAMSSYPTLINEDRRYSMNRQMGSSRLPTFFTNLWGNVRGTVTKIVNGLWTSPPASVDVCLQDEVVESPKKRSRSEDGSEDESGDQETASRPNPTQTRAEIPSPNEGRNIISSRITYDRHGIVNSPRIYDEHGIVDFKDDAPVYPLIPRTRRGRTGVQLLARAISRRDNLPPRKGSPGPMQLFGATFPNRIVPSPGGRPGRRFIPRDNDRRAVLSKHGALAIDQARPFLPSPSTNGRSNSGIKKRTKTPSKVQAAYRRSQSMSLIESEKLDVLINQLVQNKVAGFQSFEQVMKQREERQREIEKIKRDAHKQKTKREAVSPLSPELEKEVAKLSREIASDIKWHKSKLYVEKFNIPIRTEDMQRLLPGTWLNDEIINFYMTMICERTKQSADGKKKAIFHNTYFWKKMKDQGHSAVNRWARRQGFGGLELLKLDHLFIPVHVGENHWCMAVINFKQKRFEYYDSLGGSINPKDRPQPYKVMRDYVKCETGGKHDFSEWVDYAMKGAPQQNNSSDCGVFSLKTAEVISRGGAIDFTAKDMPLIRRKMMLEIARAELLP
ncbi:hypothetical protein RUND412_001751 [Rhizina undulata]